MGQPIGGGSLRGPGISFREETVPLEGIGAFERHTWWGTSLASPLPNEVWFSTPTGSNSVAWLHILDLSTSKVRRAARLAGDFRHAVCLPSGTVAVLAMYGLHEVDTAGTELRVLRRIPKYGAELLPFFHGTCLALTWVPVLPVWQSVPVVGTANWNLVRRFRLPALDLAVDRATGRSLLCSFRAGSARSINSELKVRPGFVRLPRAISPVVADERVWCAPVEEGVAENVTPRGHRGLRPTGVVAEVEPDTGRVLRDGRIFPDSRRTYAAPHRPLIGLDSSGRLIVVSPEGEVILVDPDRLEPVASHRSNHVPGTPCYVAPDRLVFTASSSIEPSLVSVSWSGDQV
jgi:hypothetical protein